jgi:hypothetical protein
MNILAGCAPGPNQLRVTASEHDAVAGFWLGLWQGFIAPFVFVASLFKSNLNIYEVHNNGGWYNFGFLFGLACFFRWRRQPGSASEVTLDAAHRLITKNRRECNFRRSN